MLRKVALPLLLALVLAGSYAWISLTPQDNVNLLPEAELARTMDKLQAAITNQLPTNLSGAEIKTIAAHAIKQAGLDQVVRGVQVELNQDDMAVSLAVDTGPKTIAVYAATKPILDNDQLIIDVSSLRMGAVPVSASTLLERMGTRLPSGVEISGNRVKVDLSKLPADLKVEALHVKDGSLRINPR